MSLYKLLPFRFQRFNTEEVFLSNEVGEFIFVSNNDFDNLVNYKLEPSNPVFLDFKAKHILTDTEIEPVLDLLAIKYRTKKDFLNNFTNLHMVVTTLRCNSNCKYCQVSRRDLEAKEYDMNEATAKKVVDTIFQSPSPAIKIEFQGGESLLNFEIVKYIVEYAEWKNLFAKRDLAFVICTNLSIIDEKKLKFLKEHKVYISTSLDGPKDIHNSNRPLQTTEDSYSNFIEKLELSRRYLGKNGVSALMTSSSYNIDRFKDVIDEYINLGFGSIFLRALNPYGFAKRDQAQIGYKIDRFIENYRNALDYIIELNLKGTYFVEYFALLLLTRILTPFSTSFVDLQSPSGVGICGAIYDYNGNVYVSDEARMLASIGDNKFLMGNVHNKTYQELFNSEFLHSITKSACLECLPECAYCAYQSYCGCDPVRNYSEHKDIIGNRMESDLCKKNKEIIRYILELLKKNDKNINQVFWSWMTGRPIEKEVL